MIKFITLKCEKGLFISKGQYSIVDNTRFNEGQNELTSTWLTNWYLLKGADKIFSYEQKVSGKTVNYRWELIDAEDNQINLPISLSTEEADEQYDSDHYIGTKCAYHKYRSLYKRVGDKLPDTWEKQEYEIDHRGTLSVTEVNNFSEMKINILSDSFGHRNESREIDLSSIVQYSDFDRMLTPPLAIHNRPCKITSEQTYRIIRAYVKDNIDPKYAHITSDYDFCFTVKKRLPIKPYERKTEILKHNGKSYARPKFNISTIRHKEYEIFEMTHGSIGYRNYPIVDGFKGDSLEDLKIQIKSYLEELIERINEPLVECTCCNGYGHILNEGVS